MNRTGKNRLKWIKGLMLLSQVALLVFTGQWLVNQYQQQRQELKKGLTDVFTNVQEEIADSLLLTKLMDTTRVNIGAPCMADDPESGARRKMALSKGGIHKILSGAHVTPEEEKRLFYLDTIVFNELFIQEMKHNGWNFRSEWIHNADSNTRQAAIFIRSRFFTDENGIVVSNYNGYLFWKMVPQAAFVIILLSITGAAFILMYRSLREQIKLSELKDDFISNMSHELKTPIATVKVALEALNNFGAIEDPIRGREYLGMASSEMNRLELLATRVLNTSLMENGNIHLQRESYELDKLVTEVIQAMQLRIQQHGATIALDVKGSNFTIAMDKLHLQGVLVNLIDNSLKYGVAPVHIHISLTEENGHVQLKHIDNGPGIPEEYKEKVFEKFFRVPSGVKHNVKGYGLGLSYAAQVMRRHNGRIAVDNATAGGCVFTLSF